MASELSESSSSSDIHTPAISVDEQQEHAGAAGTTEQGLDNDVMAVQDDLALGLELMMRKTQIESVHESGEKAQSNRETTLTMIGEHLESEICTIIVGEEEVKFHVHRAVLEQSPVFATLLKHKQEANQTLRIEFPHQNPSLVRAILQYLYGHELIQPILGTAQKVNLLCETYITAGNLELDVLQSVIINSFDVDGDHDMSEVFPYAAQEVYKKCAARWPFRDLFKRKIKENIRKEGLDGSNYHFHAVGNLVAAGGELAIDVAQALMEVFTEKLDICLNKLPNRRAEFAESQVIMMHEANDVLRAKIDAADVRFKDMEKAFDLAQKQAESDLEVAGVMVRAAQHQRESVETALENQQARAESAEARLHELSERTLHYQQSNI